MESLSREKFQITLLRGQSLEGANIKAGLTQHSILCLLLLLKYIGDLSMVSLKV